MTAGCARYDSWRSTARTGCLYVRDAELRRPRRLDCDLSRPQRVETGALRRPGFRKSNDKDMSEMQDEGYLDAAARRALQ
jgi:uncharacterized protein (DUF58 family)